MDPKPTQPPSQVALVDDEALGRYLIGTGNLPNLQLPIKSTKIGYGQSNPTFYVDDSRYASSLTIRCWESGNLQSH
jgi:hypothetical protein